jgi:hypothetical protein
MIEEQTQINVEGYVITIDSYGILHALKRHGNEPNESQVSLSEEDFLLIEQIVFEADKIEDISRYEKNALQFSKLIENEYFTIFEVITITGEKKKLYKKNRLAFKTMFVRRKGKYTHTSFQAVAKRRVIRISVYFQSHESCRTGFPSKSIHLSISNSFPFTLIFSMNLNLPSLNLSLIAL